MNLPVLWPVIFQSFFSHSVNCSDRVSVKIDHGSVNRHPYIYHAPSSKSAVGSHGSQTTFYFSLVTTNNVATTCCPQSPSDLTRNIQGHQHTTGCQQQVWTLVKIFVVSIFYEQGKKVCKVTAVQWYHALACVYCYFLRSKLTGWRSSRKELQRRVVNSGGTAVKIDYSWPWIISKWLTLTPQGKILIIRHLWDIFSETKIYPVLTQVLFQFISFNLLNDHNSRIKLSNWLNITEACHNRCHCE